MPKFDIDPEGILLFPTNGQFVFKQFFKQEGLFDKLKEYYNKDEYRFEVPEEELESIQQILEEYFYDPHIVEEISDYSVVVKRGSDYTEISRNAVLTKEKSRYRLFVLKDELSVAKQLRKVPSVFRRAGFMQRCERQKCLIVSGSPVGTSSCVMGIR